MLEVLFIGLSLGSILLLVALGLAITYGAMGVINMAHGEMVMIGAYVTVLTGIWLGANIFVAIPLAFMVTALIGLAIERVIVRRLYGRLLDTLLATWGIAILIQQAVRLELGLSFFGIHIAGLGPGLQNVSVPAALQGTFMLGSAEINRYRAFIIVVTAVLTAVTWLIMYRTPIGTQVRAIIRNPKMAAACGIDVARINALTFAFGRFRPRRRRGRDDVRFQDGIPGHGHADGGGRVHGRGDGRCRQLARVCVFGRYPRRDQWAGRGRYQRHLSESSGVRRGDHDHHPQAQRPVFAEGALSDVRKTPL